ncbi:MAG: hypothetical protein ACOZBW_08140 [Thermodesulfobacteriota bacterium]
MFALGHIPGNPLGLFMRHLSGEESFVFGGSLPPKSMGMHAFTYRYPELSSAHFWLFAVTMDAFKKAVQAAGPGLAQDVFQKLSVGLLGIDMGGGLSSPRLYSEPVF